MASLAQMPAEKVRDFIRLLIDRTRPREKGMVTAERWAYLSIEEARAIWWAIKWLELIAEGPVENTDFSIDYCRRYLLQKVDEMKGQAGEEKILHQDQRGILIMVDVERHLDNWVLSREFDELKRRRGESDRRRGHQKQKRS